MLAPAQLFYELLAEHTCRTAPPCPKANLIREPPQHRVSNEVEQLWVAGIYLINELVGGATIGDLSIEY